MIINGDLNSEPSWPTVRQVLAFEEKLLMSSLSTDKKTTFKIRDGKEFYRQIDYIFFDPVILKLNKSVKMIEKSVIG